MERHILDMPRRHDDAKRVREFVRIEREAAPSQATLSAQRQPVARGAGRIREFLRIARGREA